MTTYQADYSPLIDSEIHLDCTLLRQDKTHTTFVYFLFVRYPNDSRLVALFGADHNNVSVPNHLANNSKYVLNLCLEAATMRHGDTDSDWFDTYTPLELEFAKSWLCEALAAECEYE